MTVSTLSSNTGNHFIAAIYSGDTNFPSTSISMVQKVHAQASVTQITSSIPNPGSNRVTFLATVTPAAPPGPARTGMVSIWDGTNFLSQQELNTNGQISVTITNFGPGPHAVVARYYSDANYAASSGAVVGVPATLDQMQTMGDGTFVLGFTNVSGAPFTVLSSTDVLAPVSEWMVLGQASEVLPGQFQYSDAQALNRDAVRFYRLRSP
jgi:Bacterial Ig-like domain (group 3)